MVDGSGSSISSMKTLKSFAEIQTLMKVQGGMRPNGLRATFDPVVINPLFNVRGNIRNWYRGVAKLVTGKDVPVEHFSMFQRSHEKILLVDAAIPEKSLALIGGRNIANDYFGIGDGAKDTYNDLDILMKGVSKTGVDEKGGLVIENAISDHYNRLYNLAANKRFNDFFLKVSRSYAAEALNNIRNQKNALSGPSGQLTPMIERMAAEKFLDEGFDEGQIAILNEFENIQRKDPLKKTTQRYTNPNSIMKNMWDQLAVAKKDILIGSPFLYLTDHEISFLVNWLKEDPSRTLRILTNSTATTDAIPAQAMMEHFVMPKLLSELKKAGISSKQYEILAYGTKDHPVVGGKSRQGKLHAKFWMVDNQAIGVGTSNFDPLSRLTNSEIMANVFPEKGKTSVQALNRFYDDLKKDSTHWGSEEFNAVKSSPELRYRVWKQKLIARILHYWDVLPQD
jgi:putative cardiolipin synthase